jgi:DNA-binding beta-propeller fold protein YncE
LHYKSVVRVATVAFVLLIAAAASARAAGTRQPIDWPTYATDAARSGYNGDESTIGVGSATHLHLIWHSNLGGLLNAQAVEAAAVRIGGRLTSVIYEGSEDGDMYALRARDGFVLWHRNLGSQVNACDDLPNRQYGITGSGTIAYTGPGRGVIYVAGEDGAIHAMDLATGAEAPGWPVRNVFDPTQLTVYGGLTQLQDKLYVSTASYCDFTPYHGGVVEINLTKRSVTHRFYPSGPPSGGVSGGGVWGPGGVSVNPSNGDVFAATGNALTTPDNYLYSDAVVQLTSSLRLLQVQKPLLIGTDVDFGATPILFHPAGCQTTLVAAENKSGALVIYPAHDLAARPRQRLAISTVYGERFIGLPAWDPRTNTLYVTNAADSDDGQYHPGLIALHATNCRLSLAWQRSVPSDGQAMSPPTVANGVVYFGNGDGSTEFAFDARTGRHLWTSPATGGLFAAPTVVNGLVLVASWDQHLYAYGP